MTDTRTDMKKQNQQTAKVTAKASHPGRRSLRVGLLVAAVILIVAVATIIGLVVGAANSEHVRSSLDRLRGAASANASDSEGAKNAQDEGFWTCGMHPWVILPEPGLCPICHMDLTPLDPAKLSGEITIDPVVVQNIGVRIAPVVRGQIQQHIHSVGTVTYDETAVRDISTKISGWIEKLHVDSEGQRIETGQPLFELYSPDLYQAQEEYLLAWRASRNRDAESGGMNLLESARTRLQYFDISEQQIQALQDSGVPTKTLTINSPHAGIVTEKRAVEGMKIEPGMLVYKIADLSRVWVMVTVFEHQLPLLRQGQKAHMTLPYVAGQTFEGTVAYIYPYLNEMARQVRVRLEFENPNDVLKPGMYATIDIAGEGDSDAVLAPREAVLSTGARHVAFVSRGEGRFEPRNVQIGVASGSDVQILAGLEPGEMVVTSGQFLLDSESRMREALAKMVTGQMASDQRVLVQPVDSAQSHQLPVEGGAALDALLRAYLKIAETLANDTISNIAPRARQIASQIQTLRANPPAENPHLWHEMTADVDTIATYAQSLSDAGTIAEARKSFGHISDALDRVVAATGVPSSLGTALDRRVCGMAPEVPRDGVWLQPADSDVRNPYFGAMMLRCNLPAEHRRLPSMDGDTPIDKQESPTPSPSHEGNHR